MMSSAPSVTASVLGAAGLLSSACGDWLALSTSAEGLLRGASPSFALSPLALKPGNKRFNQEVLFEVALQGYNRRRWLLKHW